MQNQISKTILSHIQKLNKKYLWADLDEKTILQSIRNYLDSNLDKSVDSSQRFRDIEDIYLHEICAKLRNDYTIITNYIRSKIESFSYHENSFDLLNEISNLFNEIEYIPDPEWYFNSCNVDYLDKALRFIILKDSEKLKKYPVDYIYSDPIISNFIESYCSIHNLDIFSNYDDFNDFLSDDNFKIYLQDINKVPLTQEEQCFLIERIKNGDRKAEQVIIEHKLKLVLNIVKFYQNKGLEFNDLIQEGNIALLNAVRNYKKDEINFDVYVTQYIRNNIVKLIASKFLSLDKQKQLEKINDGKIILQSKFNRQPTIKELSSHIGISRRKINALMQKNYVIDSIDKALEEEYPSPEEDYMASELINIVHNMLEKAHLSAAERSVILRRFGFIDGVQDTFSAIAKDFGVSKQWITVVENRALDKLRRCKGCQSLINYASNPQNAKDFIDKYNKNVKRGQPCTKKDLDLYTIYEYFPEYDKSIVDKAIEELSCDERKALTLRFGEDLEKRKSFSDISIKSDEYTPVIKYLKVKIAEEQMLLISDKKKTNRKKGNFLTIYEYFNYPKEEVDAILDSLSDEDKILITLRFGENYQEKVKKSRIPEDKKVYFYNVLLRKINDLLYKNHNSDIIIKKFPYMEKTVCQDHYLKVIDFLDTNNPHQLRCLENIEKQIAALNLGYVDDRRFSIDAISSFFHIEKEQVSDIIKKALMQPYKEVDEFLDTMIDNELKVKRLENN